MYTIIQIISDKDNDNTFSQETSVISAAITRYRIFFLVERQLIRIDFYLIYEKQNNDSYCNNERFH